MIDGRCEAKGVIRENTGVAGTTFGPLDLLLLYKHVEGKIKRLLQARRLLKKQPPAKNLLAAFLRLLQYSVQMLQTSGHRFGLRFSWINQLNSTNKLFHHNEELSSAGSVNVVGKICDQIPLQYKLTLLMGSR